MIVARCPLRLPLGGGGTDAPEWVKANGGYAVTVAITKYVYAAVNPTFDPGYRLKYSESEHAVALDSLQHPIIREALRLFKVPAAVEVASLADIPSGTGLGS